MFDRQQTPSTLRDSEASALSPTGAAASAPPEFVYVDPHLVVLLFLLGFCLLFALIVATDALLDHLRPRGEDRSDTGRNRRFERTE